MTQMYGLGAKCPLKSPRIAQVTPVYGNVQLYTLYPNTYFPLKVNILGYETFFLIRKIIYKKMFKKWIFYR